MSKGFWVLTSGRNSPVSVSRDGKRISSLTDAILNVMYDRADSPRSSQMFRFRELASAVTSAVERDIGSEDRPDYESLDGRNGELEFYPKFYSPTRSEISHRRRYAEILRQAADEASDGLATRSREIVKSAKQAEAKRGEQRIDGAEISLLESGDSPELWVRPGVGLSRLSIDVDPSETILLVGETSRLPLKENQTFENTLRAYDIATGNELAAYSLPSSHRAGTYAIWAPDGRGVIWATNSIGKGKNDAIVQSSKVGFIAFKKNRFLPDEVKPSDKNSTDVDGWVTGLKGNRAANHFGYVKFKTVPDVKFSVEIFRNEPSSFAHVLSADGNIFAIGDEPIRFFVCPLAGTKSGLLDVNVYQADGKRVHTFGTGGAPTTIVPIGGDYLITFHNSRDYFEGRSWELRDGTAILKRTQQKKGRLSLSPAISSASVGLEFLLAEEKPTISVLNSSLALQGVFRGTSPFLAVALSPIEEYSVGVDQDGSVHCWKGFPKKDVLKKAKSYYSTSVSPHSDGARAFIVSMDSNQQMAVIDTSPNDDVAPQNVELTGWTRIRAARNGERIVASRFDLADDECPRRLQSFERTRVGTFMPGKLKVEGGGAFSLSADGKLCAYSQWTRNKILGGKWSVRSWESNRWEFIDAAANTARLCVVEVETGKLLQENLLGDDIGISCVEWSPNGKLLAVAVFSVDDSDDTLVSALFIVESATGTLRYRHDIRGPLINAIAFDSTGDYLSVACGDSWIRLWHMNDVINGPLILRGHSSPVTSLAFSQGQVVGLRDSRLRLFSGGHDSQVVVWDPIIGEQLVKIRADGDINELAVLNKGHTLIAATTRQVNIWDLKRKKD